MGRGASHWAMVSVRTGIVSSPGPISCCPTAWGQGAPRPWARESPPARSYIHRSHEGHPEITGPSPGRSSWVGSVGRVAGGIGKSGKFARSGISDPVQARHACIATWAEWGRRSSSRGGSGLARVRVRGALPGGVLGLVRPWRPCVARSRWRPSASERSPGAVSVRRSERGDTMGTAVALSVSGP